MSGLFKSPAPNLRPCQPLRGDHREPYRPLRPSSRSFRFPDCTIRTQCINRSLANLAV